MESFRKINTIAGWLVFAFATILYFLTIESTASFWDCGEFISAADKQQVVHPPGAPIFLMVGRLFIVLFGNGNEAIAMNVFSALCSSFSVLFLFWSITHMASRVLGKDGSWNESRTASAIGAGLIGALAGTFMTSLWFSAVEAEVYAMATFFFALIFWAMTRWERAADQPGGDRWLLFIALMIGLSGGVHLLSLLVIPAIGFMYYFRRYEVTSKGVIVTLAATFGILILILNFMLDRFIGIAANLDVSFVNGMGLPFGSGIMLFSLIFLAGLGALIMWSGRVGRKGLNTLALSFLFVLMGFSSYAMVLIRADARPAINMNGISDVHSFLSYLKREQYGSRALGYGPYFTAQPLQVDTMTNGLFGEKHMGRVYRKGEDKYQQVATKRRIIYDFNEVYAGRQLPNNPEMMRLKARNQQTILPRMGSLEGRHTAMYCSFLGLNDQECENYVPKFSDNLNFFWSYQMGYMFWRYHLWNFSGRQNDRQGYYHDKRNGNWITGVAMIDEAMHPHLKDLSESEKNDLAHDSYFLLPFILGLLGMVWQFRNHRNGFVVIFLFWFFMGIMNLVNSNQPPIEPRERDYALVGAFYAFAIWIGMGVLALIEIGKERKNSKVLGEYGFGIVILLSLIFLTGATLYAVGPWFMILIYTLVVCMILGGISVALHTFSQSGTLRAAGVAAVCLVAPLLMGFNNYDNHNRSNRSFALDVARNYLESTAPNAILFTQGDNDTYPLWYAQEVEGVRTDVRIINLSLLGVDWYINSLRNKINDADPVPMSITANQLYGDRLNYTSFCEESPYKDRRISVSTFIDNFITGMNGKPNPCGSEGEYVPTRLLKVDVPVQSLIDRGVIRDDEVENAVSELKFKLRKPNLFKNDLMMLDIIKTNNWNRPIYFAMTVQTESFLGLQKYFRHDGMTYQLIPVEFDGRQGYAQRANSDIMYEIIMSDNYRYGGVEEGKKIYRDPSAQSALVTLKYALYQQLAFNLINEATRLEMTQLFSGDTTQVIDPETGSVVDEIARKREQARKVLDRLLTSFPHSAMPYDANMVGVASMLLDLGEKEKALEVMEITSEIVLDELDYMLGILKNVPDRIPFYMSDIFGPPMRDRYRGCQSEETIAQMGMLGATIASIKMLRDCGGEEQANEYEAKAKEVYAKHAPIFFAPYIPQACQNVINQKLGGQ
jgi:hypothetical protein